MDSGEKKKRATYQDVLDAPPRMIAELIDGDLHLSNHPKGPAVSVSSTLGVELGSPFHRGRGGPGGWIIVHEPELHLDEDVLVPDLAGWRRERMPVIPADYFELAPDWICEVLSRSTEKYDRTAKLRAYAAHGVKYAWLVHPMRRTLEAYRLHAGQWLSVAALTDNERGRIEPFDAIEIDLAVLWADLPLPTRAGEDSGELEYEYQLSLPQ